MTRPASRSVDLLLRLRRQDEDRARRALLEAQADKALIERRLSTLRESLDESTAAVRQTLLEGARPTDMTTYRRRVGLVRREIASSAGALGAADSAMLERRGALAGAIRQRRALESLVRARTLRQTTRRARQAQLELEELHAIGVSAMAPRDTETV
jgi:flagellar export protein FliJ